MTTSARAQPAGPTGDIRPAQITVGVVTYRSTSMLPGLLESLPAGMAGTDWHLVVADNASDDRPEDVLRELAPAASFLPLGANLGYAAGVNACVGAAADADAVLILNPDIRLAPGSGRMLADALRAAPGVGITVPRLAESDGSLALSLRRRPTLLRALGEAVLGGRRARRFAALSEIVADPAVYAGPARADWATGAAMLIDRRCLSAVGPWDESFFLYSEETDFALRCADKGLGLQLVPGARAVHVGGQAHSSPHLWTTLTVNRVVLFARRNGPITTAAFWLAVVLGEALRARRAPTHRAALRSLLQRRSELLSRG